MGIFEDICKFPGQTGGEECRSYREESDYTHILTPPPLTSAAHSIYHTWCKKEPVEKHFWLSLFPALFISTLLVVVVAKSWQWLLRVKTRNNNYIMCLCKRSYIAKADQAALFAQRYGCSKIKLSRGYFVQQTNRSIATSLLVELFTNQASRQCDSFQQN